MPGKARRETEKLINDDLLFLREMVNTPSPSNDPHAVQNVQRIIADELERYGFSCSSIRNFAAPSADLLFAQRKGLSGQLTLTFICHADTVLKPSKNYQLETNEDGSLLLGPGVADDKGGVFVLLRGLKLFTELFPYSGITLNVISSPNEELGSPGFHRFFQDIGEKSDIVLGFEPALKTGDIISSRNGNKWFHLEVQGKSAHAGRTGEPYLNAAHELAQYISELGKINCHEKGIRVNVGSFKGGSGHFNVICGSAEAKIDTRFPCFDTKSLVDSHFNSVLEKQFEQCTLSGRTCDLKISIEDDCPPMPFKEHYRASQNFYSSLISNREKRAIKCTHAGGAADINHFSTAGNFTLDGLGPVGGALHTRHEYIETSTLFSRSQTFFEFLSHIQSLEDTPGETYGIY